jgi:hypothetical protein
MDLTVDPIRIQRLGSVVMMMVLVMLFDPSQVVSSIEGHGQGHRRWDSV